MSLRKLRKKLKKLGVKPAQYKRLVSLSNPKVSKKLFCSECYSKLFMKARSGKRDIPDVKQLCKECKGKLEVYIEEGEE